MFVVVYIRFLQTG